MTRAALALAAGLAVAAALAAVPVVASGYHLALAISVLQFAVLATAWALFSGPTKYVSLATVAFFGVGAYTVAVGGETLPWPAVLMLAAAIGMALAVAVGVATLRLSGPYFVIFTFGLSELIRQLVTWFEVNVHRSVGRYVFLDISQSTIYWELLALLIVVLIVGWLIGRSPLGLALRLIGGDETVARHCGIGTTAAKLTVFAISAMFMSLTGAVMAPRWTYIDPAIAFNPLLSFQVVIMALLGGAGILLGPVFGVVPLVLLFEFLSANYPNHFSILLGAAFIVIVFLVPNGVAGALSTLGGSAAPRRAARPVPEKRPAGAVALDVRPNPPPPGDSGSLLAVASLRKTFGGLVAVDDLSFGVSRGEIVGLIGPNGSGKTTALNLLSGALRPDGGGVSLGGRAIAGLPAHRIARQGVARTFQLVRVIETMTCRDNVIAGLAFRPPPLWGGAAARQADALLAEVGLAARGDTPAGELTYIDRKRLELARALALHPSLLLLDEWLAGLNPTELADGIALLRELRARGASILLVEHVMDAIRALCDRCIVMNAGRLIAEGSPAAVLADPAVVAAYLGAPDA